MLQCHITSISLPKLGNLAAENEDNILKPSDSEIKSNALARFAISDGATDASFSKEWSELLVSAYKDKSFDKIHLPETIKTISKTWQSSVDIIKLPWYAQQKAENGAFATFLGLTINREENVFDIVAIGDCTLFQIRNGDLVFSFPVTSVEDFNNTPNLIASNEKYQTDFENKVVYHNGNIRPNDIIILATDALAVWILKQKHRNKKIRKNLIEQFEKHDEKTFEEWLNKKRATNRIKNDDVTLLMIKFE
jgi:serine/threonine protein phosphatase PrpC